ncbi:hypothetical protein [Aeromicrobium sp. UC242_57]|uniref:hypothetical protein n=1 Tax=Aeromicrobium sp. UC242_57 TaxID=3374624 RepID=UPI00379878AC
MNEEGCWDTATFPTTRAGYTHLLAWLANHGQIAMVGIEGTGSYGAALARFLRTHGINLVRLTAPIVVPAANTANLTPPTRSPQPAQSSPVSQPGHQRPATASSRRSAHYG